MFPQRGLRRQHAINPFVALSDVTISVILILLVYFTGLVLVQGGRIYALESEKQQLAREKERIAREKSELERETVERTKRIRASQAMVAEVLNEPRFAAYRGQITVAVDGDDQVFTFGEQVLFPQGSAVLSPQGTQLLLLFGGALEGALVRQGRKSNTYPELQVLGHTDTVVADNWTLSVNRALAVVKVFSAQHALRQASLSAAGYSCHRPRIQPQGAAAEPRNRRIEIRLLYGNRPVSGHQFVPNAPYDCDCDR